MNTQLTDFEAVSSFGATMNYTIMNIVIHEHSYTCAHTSIGYIYKSEIAGSKVLHIFNLTS